VAPRPLATAMTGIMLPEKLLKMAHRYKNKYPASAKMTVLIAGLVVKHID
jgi:hypothetical protein